MSIGFQIEVGSDDSEGYTVKRLGGCTIIKGTVPMTDLGNLLKGRKKEYMSAYLARKYGCTFFFGPKDEIHKLNDHHRKEDELNLKAALEKKPNDYHAWLQYGDVGESSKFMLRYLSGLWKSGEETRSPSDYDDFQRCVKMLKLFPHLQEKLESLKDFQNYKKLVDVWPELSSIHDEFVASGKKSMDKAKAEQFRSILDGTKN